MAKAKTAVVAQTQFTVTFSAKDSKAIVDSILESITEDFTTAQIKASGIDMVILRDSIANDPKLAKEISTIAVEHVKEMFSYRDDGYENKQLDAVYDKLEKFAREQAAAAEAAKAAAKKADQAKEDAARLIAALDLVKKAGYKIVS